MPRALTYLHKLGRRGQSRVGPVRNLRLEPDGGIRPARIVLGAKGTRIVPGKTDHDRHTGLGARHGEKAGGRRVLSERQEWNVWEGVYSLPAPDASSVLAHHNVSTQAGRTLVHTCDAVKHASKSGAEMENLCHGS